MQIAMVLKQREYAAVGYNRAKLFPGLIGCQPFTLEVGMDHRTIPFSQRKVDWFIVGFFLINLFFITYIVDIEQIILPDPLHFRQPLWLPLSKAGTGSASRRSSMRG
jgi:hypothetical protein